MKTINFKGKHHRVFTVKFDYGEENLILTEERYCEPETLAVQAWCVENGIVTEPFATLTVNLDGWTGLGLQSESKAYLDSNNCPWAVAFLTDNDLIRYAGTLTPSGFCIFPLYEWDTKKFYAE